jgi:predicted ATPase
VRYSKFVQSRVGGGLAVGFRELVGREEELASLLTLLDARDQLPAVVVTGEAGIGKTTLSLAAVEAAQERGYLVLSCRPAEAETAFSFVGLSDLIGGVLSDVLPELPQPQRRALELRTETLDVDSLAL